jgi:exonuclease III
MDEPWHFASWNVAGLCHPHRKYKVLNWIKTRRTPLAALALQELKTDDFRLDVALQTILPRYQYFSSPPYEGRGGSALLLQPSLPVTSSGMLNEGRVTWVIVSHPEGPVGLASIYAPNSSQLRATLWEELKNTLPSAKWILSGDYNMTESRSDSTGFSPSLQGRELEAWRLLKTRFNFQDAYSISGKIDGALYTWRRTRGQVLVQSRIDRFYLSDGGWWLDSIKKLQHDGAQALSDDDPIILLFCISPPAASTSCIKKTLPFRANPAVLKFKGAVEQLKAAWDYSKDGDHNPHYQFHNACRRLRTKYMELQKAPNEQNGELAILRAKL